METIPVPSINSWAAAWLEYCRDPDAFVRDFLRSFNDPWQKAALDHLFDPKIKFLVIASGHGPGKTRLATHALLSTAFLWGEGVRIPCTAPKAATLRDKLWPEIFKVLMKADQEIRAQVEWMKTKVIFCGTPGWEALAETARDVEGLAGHHEQRVLFIVEEASGVADEYWPAIEGALSTPGSKLMAISNPTRGTGQFARFFRKPRPEVKLMKVSWNPRGVDGIKPRDPTRAYSERTSTGAKVEVWYSDRPAQDWALNIIDKYGYDHAITRVRVRGEFPLVDEDALVSSQHVWDAYGREIPDTGDLDPLVVTWDVAGAGRDLNMTSQRRGSHVLTITEITETNVSIAAEMVADEIEIIQPDQVNIDCIGIGTGPTDQLLARGLNVTPVNVGTAAPGDASSEFANLRAWAYWQLRLDLIAGKISYDRSIPEEIIERLAEELEATRWYITPTGKIAIIRKDLIKENLDRSPDTADTQMLFYAEPVFSGEVPSIISRARSADADWAL